MPDVFYTAGTVVSYNGANYVALVNQTDYTGTGWNPTTASLWSPTGASSGGGTHDSSGWRRRNLDASCRRRWYNNGWHMRDCVERHSGLHGW